MQAHEVSSASAIDSEITSSSSSAANITRTDNARVNIDALQRDQIWRTIQAWCHSIEIVDLDQFRTYYAEQLEEYYGKADVPLSDVVLTMASKVRNYTSLTLRASNPSFREVAPNLVQVDYDKHTILLRRIRGQMKAKQNRVYVLCPEVISGPSSRNLIDRFVGAV